MNVQRLKHDPYPVYLGVTSDRTLSYREHLSRNAANSLIAKLAGTSCGASTLDTLRTSVFSSVLLSRRILLSSGAPNFIVSCA